jgi:4'-phosphopantetheinyl transferase
MRNEPSAVLRPREVHVWAANLDRPPLAFELLDATLSSDEHDRAERFRFPRDRDRFVTARGLLRTLLSLYVGRAARDLGFRYSVFGKPELTGERISFNVSHADATALFAFTREAEVGVDLERVRTGAWADDVAQRFFADGEVAALRALPPYARPRAFLACWTRKEAYIKARGEGLSLPLQDFEVTLDPTVEPALVRTAWSPSEPKDWQLLDVSAAVPGYVAALAVRSDAPRLVLCRFGAEAAAAAA